MKVLCLGHISYDIIFPLKGFIEENKKIRIKEKIECGGGPASNAAYLLGKWGIETYIAGVVGNDLYGNEIKNEFEISNVNTKYLEIRNDFETDNSIIINNQLNGSRTILTYIKEKEKMQELHLDFEPDIILIDGHEFEESKRIITKYPKAIVVLDAGRASKEVVELAKMVNYVVASKDFAEEVTGIKINYDDQETLKQLYSRLESMFSGMIVITLEDKGCIYKYNGELGIMDALEVEALDTTGAGDIFHGAFVYGLTKGYNINVVLTIATIAGSLSVTKVSGRAVPSKEEMRRYIHDFE
ncbi:MAG: PfkB family carbohydrate kinase [Erysipelotrichaceae bacterium]|nr:PfkB family carbohydrate kinase [Erysipelotrichaceae bacterium]